MIFLLHGNDDFSIANAAQTITGNAAYDMNVSIVESDAIDFDTLRQMLQTLPFLSEKRLVVIRGLPKQKEKKAAPAEDDSSAGKRKKKKTAETGMDPLEALAQLLQTAPETTDVIIISSEKLKDTHLVYEVAKQQGSITVFDKPEKSELRGWIADRIKKEGATAEPDALDLLEEYSNDDLRTIAQEINKLVTYTGVGTKVTSRDVRNICCNFHEAGSFELMDLIGKRNSAAALKIAHEYLSNGMDPIAITGQIALQIRTLIKMKDLVTRRAPQTEIQEALNMKKYNPYRINSLTGYVRNFTMEKLQRLQQMCLQTDSDLKLSKMDPLLALDLLIIAVTV